MKSISLFLNFRSLSNLVIILLIALFALGLGSKTYRFVFEQDQINVVRIDVPWNQPLRTVTLMFDVNVLQNNPELLRQINKSIYLYDIIKRALFSIFLLLILVQLKRLIIAIRGQTFFEAKNLSTIRNLSVLVGVLVGVNFFLYHALWLFIPEELVVESINFISLKESFLSSILLSFDFKLLFVSLVLYAISVSFREGYQLKEQTELTI